MRVSSRRGARRFSILTGAVVAALFLMVVGAPRARAVEFVYWDNSGEIPAAIGWASLDGSAGGPLSTEGVEIDGPGGMSYDPVTNRLYVASEASAGGSGLIAYVNLDGSGGGILPTPAAAPVNEPRAVVVDPVARIAYWLNAPLAEPETISWARLDGSEGDVLPLQGATLLAAARLAVDPAGGRIYWGNGDGSIGFAPLVGSGGTGGTLPAQGAGLISGLAVDSASDRIFWLEEGIGKVLTAGLGGATAGEVEIGTAPIAAPWGLAFDPTLANPRLYWANRGNGTTREGAIGFTGILPVSMGGKVSPPAGAPVNGPQDPVIIKSPVNTAPPTIPEGPRPLTCTQGSWAPDYVSSFVYQAPVSFSYQWTLNEELIPGATEPSYPAPLPGHYKCIVTASNTAGSTSKASQGAVVTITVRPRKPLPSTPAKLVLVGKARKLTAKPGKLLILGVGVANQGTVASTPAKLCLKLTKKAKRALRAGDCVELGPLAGGATATAKLRLRVRRRAKPGAYKLTITLPGAAIEVRVKVFG